MVLAQGQVMASGKVSGCTKTVRLGTSNAGYLISHNDDLTTEVTVLGGAVEAH